jgi:lipopolysaccharide export system permease protein
MKILDRYVLWSFIKNYLISFMVLIGLYIVLDMVFNFDELAEVKSTTGSGGLDAVLATVSAVADYYWHQSFLFFLQLSGIIPVVAAAFTLMRMSRFNELTAVLAAGVPLLRVATPIILCGVIINFVLLPIDQELLVPGMIPKLTRKHDELQQSGVKSYPLKMMQDERHGLVNAGRYYPPSDDGKTPARMEILDVIERDEHGDIVGHLMADAAEWDAGRSEWKLTTGSRVANLRQDQTPTPEQPVEVWHTTAVTPEEIALFRSGDFVELLSTERINELLQRPKSYGTIALLRVKHFRWSQMLINIVLLLLAIPCVLTREPGTLKLAATKALILTGLCMASIFLSRQLAGNPPVPGASWANHWPLIMAWVPIFLFLPLAIFLLDRTHTKGT